MPRFGKLLAGVNCQGICRTRQQEIPMSKITIMLAVGATLALSACARKAPEPAPVMAQPIMVEPAAGKGKYR
jgi:hypothetical protein